MKACKKTTNIYKIGSLYTFLLLYKTMTYTGSAKSNGTIDLEVCNPSSN